MLLSVALNGEVKEVNDDDSLFYRVANYGSGAHHIVVEAEYDDQDGVMASISVHMIEDTLVEVEIYKADGSRLKAPIDPDQISIIWPAEKGDMGWWER